MLHVRSVQFTGWHLLIAVLLGSLMLMLATAALVMLGGILLVLLGVIGLHALVLPRLARRTNLSPIVLAVLLLPLLLGVAWLVASNPEALLMAGLVWLAGVAAPQLALAWVRRRLGVYTTTTVWQRSTSLPSGSPAVHVLEAEACPRCGWTRWTAALPDQSACPRCGAPLMPRRG